MVAKNSCLTLIGVLVFGVMLVPSDGRKCYNCWGHKGTPCFDETDIFDVKNCFLDDKFCIRAKGTDDEQRDFMYKDCAKADGCETMQNSTFRLLECEVCSKDHCNKGERTARLSCLLVALWSSWVSLL